jgi:hypothetical protein
MADPANENVEYRPDIDIAQLVQLGKEEPFLINF